MLITCAGFLLGFWWISFELLNFNLNLHYVHQNLQQAKKIFEETIPKRTITREKKKNNLCSLLQRELNRGFPDSEH